MRLRLTPILAGLLVAAFLLHAAPARAVDPGVVLERNIYKTVTYEVLTNAWDAAMLGVILGGSLATAPVFVTVNATAAAVSYYVHETAWDLGFEDQRPFGSWTLGVRAGTYRIISSAKTYGLALLFTGDPTLATAFAFAGGAADVTIYLTNDWAWNWYWPLEQDPDGAPTIEVVY